MGLSRALCPCRKIEIQKHHNKLFHGIYHLVETSDKALLSEAFGLPLRLKILKIRPVVVASFLFLSGSQCPHFGIAGLWDPSSYISRNEDGATLSKGADGFLQTHER